MFSLLLSSTILLVIIIVSVWCGFRLGLWALKEGIKNDYPDVYKQINFKK